MRNARGSMLILALWTLSMLVVLSVSLGFGVRQKAALLSRLSTLDAVYPIAYSGVEQAKSLVVSDRDMTLDCWADPWSPRGPETENVAVTGGSFSLASSGPFTVVDEERKVNLNRTSVEILSRLLERVSGLKKDSAQELVYNLLDWMDSDSFFGHPQHGAEASYYENLEKPYTAKNLPYESLDELLLVKGMDPALLNKIRPYVTLYGSGRINMNTADRQVLSALGLSENAVDLIARYREGADGREGTNDDRFFTDPGSIAGTLQTVEGSMPLDRSDVMRLEGLITEDRLSVASTVFSVISRGTLEKNGAFVEVEAVFNRKGQGLYQHTGEVQWPARA